MQALYCCSGHINVAHKCGTNGLRSSSNGIHSCHGSFHRNIIKIIFIHDIPQIVLGRNSRLREAADPWVVNKYEKQSVFHLKAESSGPLG